MIGANLAAMQDDGSSALHVAASFGYLDCCQLLVKSRIKLDLLDNNGQSALDLAKEHPGVYEYLSSLKEQ
ncbi:hypothetical protein EDD86DRAFT_207260 [Gorgonomyces haynaldii]|nr:hypothetical protein EDD86DRAFT_213023 [Gorgonomyces haynaldii]KAI8909231.1 hypothetical protein EDD86DRAFT_207260 [Gorgonomyces haynaldii]